MSLLSDKTLQQWSDCAKSAPLRTSLAPQKCDKQPLTHFLQTLLDWTTRLQSTIICFHLIHLNQKLALFSFEARLWAKIKMGLHLSVCRLKRTGTQSTKFTDGSFNLTTNGSSALLNREGKKHPKDDLNVAEWLRIFLRHEPWIFLTRHNPPMIRNDSEEAFLRQSSTRR